MSIPKAPYAIDPLNTKAITPYGSTLAYSLSNPFATDPNLINSKKVTPLGDTTTAAATPTVQNTTDTGSLVDTSGTGSGSGTGSDDRALADAYGQAFQTYQASLAHLPTQLNIAKQNNQGTYNTNLNELDTTKNNSENSYKSSTTQNGQSFLTNKNTIADQASTGLRGLLRILGAYGSGGSATQFVAPQAVADNASQARAGANQTFATNQSGLDTNWGNFVNEDTNSRKKLTDWLANENQAAEKTSVTNEQSLLNKLAESAGYKAAYTGGSYAGASQPYIDKASALNSKIDSLSGVASRTYDGKTPVYTAKSLASYIPTQNVAQVSSNATQDVISPYLNLLLKKENQL